MTGHKLAIGKGAPTLINASDATTTIRLTKPTDVARLTSLIPKITRTTNATNPTITAGSTTTTTPTTTAGSTTTINPTTMINLPTDSTTTLPTPVNTDALHTLLGNFAEKDYIVRGFPSHGKLAEGS